AKRAAGQGVESGGSFFERIARSFQKNFIREDRWKLILQGLGTTCLITGASVALGSLLALAVCLFRRTGSRLANAISNVYVRLLQGTPIVVLLMILYYVVLGKTGLDAVWVAIIAFTLNYGAYGSEIMRTAIEAVPEGQREAALALGYSEQQAFRDFIFPQAAVRFLPVLRGEMISLLKSTSVVGYIAIQDLTKMSDIIRSRTYEAFFPLITTALIYFALAWVITLIMTRILACVDARKRVASGRGANAR
ncbi:MAG: amino acid ABC transporter permease, partial [Atopobiaceae bacterium]|nr:amino acid ABC transporter permease [Atopobiaceae bacterium]